MTSHLLLHLRLLANAMTIAVSITDSPILSTIIRLVPIESALVGPVELVLLVLESVVL